MKVVLLVSTLPSLIDAFSMNGMVPPTRASSVSVTAPNVLTLHARPPNDVEDAFDNLKKELNDDLRDNPTVDQMASKSKKWVNQYFDLFAGMNRDMASSQEEAAYNEKELGKQRDLANKVIDFAIELGQDLSSLNIDGSWRPRPKTSSSTQGTSFSPRYSIKDDDTVFQVMLELPGVDIADINIELDKKMNVIVISGCRSSLVSNGKNIPFSERFELGLEVDTDKISANLDKGILTVSAPKEKPETSTQRVPIVSGN